MLIFLEYDVTHTDWNLEGSMERYTRMFQD
jgi:hypothetical protein